MTVSARALWLGASTITKMSGRPQQAFALTTPSIFRTLPTTAWHLPAWTLSRTKALMDRPPTKDSRDSTAKAAQGMLLQRERCASARQPAFQTRASVPEGLLHHPRFPDSLALTLSRHSLPRSNKGPTYSVASHSCELSHAFYY